MTIDSLTFVYLFLPVAVALFYGVPNTAKKPVLAGITLVFYALAAPEHLPLFFSCVTCDYLLVRLMEIFDENQKLRRLCLGLSAGKLVLLLLFLGGRGDFSNFLLPLGVVVSSLNGLGYLVEAYRRESPYEHNPVDFFLFTSFFGSLYCGPLVRYRELMPQLKKLRPSLTSISKGVVLFAIGLAKKVLLADALLAVYRDLQSLVALEKNPLVTLAMILSLALTVFLTFSSCSDMARGMGRIFSLEYPRNFYYPYQAKTVTEWLERFNSSYYEFCREYFSLPGTWFSKESRGQAANLLWVGLLGGLWFGLRPTLLLWGLILGAFSLMEQYLYPKLLRYFPIIFRRAYTFAVMLLAFTAMASPNIGQFWGYLHCISQIFTYQASNGELLYLLSANVGTLAIGLLLSTSILDLAGVFLRRHLPVFSDAAAVCGNLVLLVITTAFMLG